jgi:putative Ca2+/H+ antiporter (TMEM165/GDT1 family)
MDLNVNLAKAKSARANRQPTKHASILLRRIFFLKFLSEMGQQSGNVALMFAARHDIFFAMRRIPCIGRCLGCVAI